MIIQKDKYANVKIEILNQLMLTGNVDLNILTVNEEEAKKLIEEMKVFVDKIQTVVAK